MTPLEKEWGGAKKVYTTKRSAFDRLVDSKNPHKFAQILDAFHTAAALGLRLEGASSPEDGTPREELLNVYSIDPDGLLWAAVSARFPEASGAERFSKLLQYADFGIQRLDEEFRVYENLQSAIDAILQ